MKALFFGGPLDGAEIEIREIPTVFYYPIAAHDFDAQRHKYVWDGSKYVYEGAEPGVSS